MKPEENPTLSNSAGSAPHDDCAPFWDTIKSEASKTKSNTIKIPSIELPKGGGAIKSIDEKFSVNAANGTSSFGIPLPLTQGRNSFSPSIGISYNSGTGNSILGIGWSLDLPSIQRRTDKLLPTYNDAEDTFIFAGAEDLVPYLKRESGAWKPDEQTVGLYSIKRYRPRIEGAFSRMEKITHPSHGSFWKITSRDNITTFFGFSASARITDPAGAENTFQWLPEFSYDDKGNCLVYEYKQENTDNVPNELHERNRLNGTAQFTNSYLKRIKYGNRVPCYIDAGDPYAPVVPTGDFLFEAVFDFGEHDALLPTPQETLGLSWGMRVDPFSSYRSGFEIRTYRLLKRVLMFHTFDELNAGKPTLVRSMDFGYQASSAGSPQQSEVTYCTSLTQCGYILKPDNTYSKKSLPPVEYSYELLHWSSEIKEVDRESLLNEPSGISNTYQWVDFYGEGISGMFTEQGNGWFYKANFGDCDEDGGVRFDHLQTIVPKPSFAGMSSGVLQLQDIDADGQKQIVGSVNGVRGYFELTDENTWLPFTTFKNSVNIDFRNPDVRMIDLNGDGKPDVLITEDQVFTLYLSKGKDGYEPARKTEKPFDEEKGPAIVFMDAKQTIFLADMNGDGLTDIVRIRNGEVCYWPNLGYGNFGAKVAMSNAPLLDFPDNFNPAYIRLADVSGTGATDLIYLGKYKCSAYLNLSGNAWSDEQEITASFPTELPNTISVVDLLGNGTACIVWSSALPGNAVSPMRYIDLMGGKKPHLLKKYVNNLGKETSLYYKSSTWFYIKDKLEYKPWITKLPFPVHCVRKVETVDRVTGARFTNKYRYHHGYYDHSEREFRGFGMVEQTDTETYENWIKGGSSNIVESDLHQAPILTKTWFHTGAFTDDDRILTQYATEYWYEELQRQGFIVTTDEAALPDARLVAAANLDPALIAQLTPEEWREAYRACKGMTLRQEIFALDAPAVSPTAQQVQKQLTPYSVAAHTCLIELIQQRAGNRYAVYMPKESEAITYTYERDAADPRIAHSLSIRYDELGNALESAMVVYGRKIADLSLPPDARQKQQKNLITYIEQTFTNDAITGHEYRLRLVSESKTWELKGVPKTGELYSLSDFATIIPTSTEIAYHQVNLEPGPGTSFKRLIEHVRTLFYKNDLSGALPLHTLESKAITFESYQKAYTPALVTDIFAGKVTDLVLLGGKFTHSEGDLDWWIRSGAMQFLNGGETISDARNRFYTPVSYTEPFGAVTAVHYFKNYYLLIDETTDALLNRFKVDRFNLRTLAPQRVIDVNDNISEAIADELGFVKAIAVFGKGSQADDLTGLSEYSTPAEEVLISDFFSAAASDQLTLLGKNLLQHSSSCFIYDLQCYKNSGGILPVVAASVVREQHAVLNPDSPVQLGFEYTNGLGGVVMKKTQAEPGKAKQVVVNPDNTVVTTEVDTSALIPKQLRWLGNGRTILNNKGKPVRQYEPYFSVTHRYEDNKELVETGVSPVLYYDPPGRLIKIEFPDGTFSRTEFDSWKQVIYDRNDTVLDSLWYVNRFNRLIDAELIAAGKDPVQEKSAAEKAAKHAQTPIVLHFDTLGRPMLLIENNGKDSLLNDILFLTANEIDIEGNSRSITDSRANTVVQYKYDMLGNRVFQKSMDAGQRWMIQNIVGNPLRTWDERNHELQFGYDILHRPISTRVKGGDGPAPLDNEISKIIYGEGQPSDKALNLRAKIAVVYDTAGKVTSAEYDFRGNLVQAIRKFAANYKETVNWDVVNPDALLEADAYTFGTVYDALNRIISQTSPDNSIFIPQYNEANLLDQVWVTQNGGTQPYVKNIDYNEKGQRSKILYGNDVTTDHYYDKETFRLIRLQTKRSNNDPLQDLRYTFDPTGNITHCTDANIPDVFFNNQKITGTAEYTYDPLYRLIQASGREHPAQVSFGAQDNWDDAPFMEKYSRNDPMVWRTYTQEYRYDGVGNIVQMRHTAGGGNWTRDYTYAVNNNRLLSTMVGADTWNYSYHPQHGFITVLPHLPVMRWNFKDELEAVSRQNVVVGTPETTYYVYDGKGNRVRKVTEWQANAGVTNPPKKSQRLYLGSVEIYNDYDGSGTSLLKRYTYHIMDGKQRIALIETRTEGTDESPARLVRYQFSNHLGSAILETDDTGRVISYEEFHPFGTTAYQAVDKDIKAAHKRYRYTAMERDEETGLEYHSARYYVPWLGRWLSCDPAGIKGGINSYAYAKANAIKKVDTSGTWDIDWGEVAIGFGVAAVGVALVVVTAGVAGPAVVAGAATILGVSEATVVTGVAVVGTAAGIVGTAQTASEVTTGTDSSGHVLSDAERSRALGRLPVEALATVFGARGLGAGGGGVPPAAPSLVPALAEGLEGFTPQFTAPPITLPITATPSSAVSGAGVVSSIVFSSMMSGGGGSSGGDPSSSSSSSSSSSTSSSSSDPEPVTCEPDPVTSSSEPRAVAPYRSGGGHHVHQSASYSTGGPSATGNPNHGDAVCVDLEGHSADITSEHGRATAVQRLLNRAVRGSFTGTTEVGDVTITASGEGTLPPTATPYFEDTKALYSMAAADAPGFQTGEDVLNLVCRSSDQLPAPPVRVPSR